MSPAKSRHAPPKAGAMIEALRGLGYTTANALADIIDNSIFAHADTVDLLFSRAGATSNIAVIDNGEGMDEHELDLAMRLGEKSPLDRRTDHDLGRFGLGLKTASFSQCRRLTVASHKTEEIHCLRWDLDVLAASTDDGWYLLEGPAEGSEDLLAHLRDRRGTLVLWENLDRIVTPGFSGQDFLDLIDRVEQHLALVFHRFLAGPDPRLRLNINHRPVEPRETPRTGFAGEPPVEIVEILAVLYRNMVLRKGLSPARPRTAAEYRAIQPVSRSGRGAAGRSIKPSVK